MTTSHHPTPAVVRRAEALATQLGWPLVPRHPRAKHTGPEPAAFPQDRPRLVVERHRLTLRLDGGRLALRYHPGMAVHRLRRLAAGQRDPFVEATGLGRDAHTLLDGTLGLAADALVAAWQVGPSGRVVGLERVAVLALLVREGLQDFPWPDPAWAAAAHRVEVRCDDYHLALPRLPPGSFDVVYFDPMFETGLPGSSAMQAWRRLAVSGGVPPEAVAQARRVASRRVVLKERAGSPRLELLAPPILVRGASGRVVYGVWPTAGSGDPR